MRRALAVAALALALGRLRSLVERRPPRRRRSRRATSGPGARPGRAQAPRSAAASRRRRPAVAQALAAGTVGVVGVEGDVGVRPEHARRLRRRDARRSCAGSAGSDSHRVRRRHAARCATATPPARPAASTTTRRRQALRPAAVRAARRTSTAPRSRSPGDEHADDLRAGAVLIGGRTPPGAGARRRGGRPRCPHSGHGERAISSRHQRHVHGFAAASSSAASPRRRPGTRRSRPACRCPTTSGRSASARPAAPRGCPAPR